MHLALCANTISWNCKQLIARRGCSRCIRGDPDVTHLWSHDISTRTAGVALHGSDNPSFRNFVQSRLILGKRWRLGGLLCYVLPDFSATSTSTRCARPRVLNVLQRKG